MSDEFQGRNLGDDDDDISDIVGLRIDEDKLAVASQVEVVEDALIVITHAYDHRGNPLIEESGPSFRGFPGVSLRVHWSDCVESVALSPIHGDSSKIGGDRIPSGTKCSVRSSVVDEELLAYAPCPCGRGTLRAIFLNPDPANSAVAAICDVWGCRRSRLVDEWEILSEFVESESSAA